MLEKLSEALRKATNKVLNSILLDKNVVESLVKDLQRALIEADVNVQLVKDISTKLREEAYSERLKGIDKKEHLIKMLHDELAKILGESKKIEFEKEKTIVMLVGLYGTGKTTTIAKLGNYYSKRGEKVLLVGLDTHRPAASEQIKQLAEKNKINYFIKTDEKNPLKIWKSKELKKEIKNSDLIFVDTAGRHTLDEDLIEEIKSLGNEIKPDEIILVMPADIGQSARKLAKEFKDAVKVSGVIITRMDSTAKAGGALTACYETNVPVFFIGNGEKINDVEEFDKKSFLSRLLGMGDLEALINKVRSVTDEKNQEEIRKKIEEGDLSIEDFIEQSKTMNSIGGFEKIKSMIPGFSSAKLPENILENQEKKISKWEHIAKSMTQEEKNSPEILEKQTSRMARIAKGSGVHTSDVRSLIKQYKILREMLKTGKDFDVDMSQGLNQKQLQKIAKKFGKLKKFKI